MAHYLKFFVILAITIILFVTLSEARQKRPSRRRQPGRGLSRFLPFGKKPRGRIPSNQESKNVFYYSLPHTTQRPRIILGDELNFEDLGLQRPLRQQRQHRPLPYPKPSPTSLSALEQAYPYDDDVPVPHPPLPQSSFSGSGRIPPSTPHQKRPRSRGPGYRRERPWEGQTVLEHNYIPQKRKPLAVMPYLFSAGKNLAGAYRAAIIQSANVAKFTGHTASKYFKGVRNLMGVKDLSRSDLNEPEPTQQASNAEGSFVLKNELPQASANDEVVEIDLSNNVADGESLGKLPKVYLDWGGSFWRFFYNKAEDVGPKERTRDDKKRN